MSRMFYRGAKAAIVTYDVTNEKTWEKVEFWVKELVKYEESCKIYIVGTKTDLLVKSPSVVIPSTSVTSKKLPNVYKSCPKMILLEKLKILTPLKKFA